MKSNFYELLGVKINLLSMKQLNFIVEEAITLDTKWVIANHNLNSLYLYHHNSGMRDFYDLADYIHVDGMSLILLGKILDLPCRRFHRVTYVDWVWSLMASAIEENWRIFYLGSKPGIADKGASILRKMYPNLQIATSHGYFPESANEAANQEIIKQIKNYQPHVLMVGMGMPRQEKWILENLGKIDANIILPSGACIDYIAGEISIPPRWMGKVGLEWLYRLITEPKRLWRRYLVEPRFIAIMFFYEYFTSLKNKLIRVMKRRVE